MSNPQIVTAYPHIVAFDAIVVDVARALRQRQWRLACAESCTGGLVAAACTALAGSSDWFERGFVTYSNESKVEMLGVEAATIAAHGAVSEAVVSSMALGALERSHANVSVAISGVAGPGGGSVAKPVGTACFAWAAKGRGTVARVERCLTLKLPGARDAVREASVITALQGVLALSAMDA